jgi:uncharacterized protein YecE (DUF72 family)
MSGFDLLGDPLPEPATKPPRAKKLSNDGRDVAAAPVPPALAELATRLPQRLFLGTSTWSFPGWRGLVYADEHSAQRLSRDGLRAYSKHPLLKTVGVDRTFYAAISEHEFARYADQVPESFSFLCKAPNAITSPFIQGTAGYTTQRNPGFLDVSLAMRSFVQPALAGLGNKAGPLVFQFSPLGKEAVQTPETTVEKLLGFLRALRHQAGAKPQLAIEVRNESVLTPAFAAGLADIGVDYCLGVHPRMPSAAEQWDVMADAMRHNLVVRWSLNPNTGQDYEGAKEQYAPFNALVDIDMTTRETLANAAAKALKAGEKVHLVANNKAEGSSPLTMFALAQMIIEKLSAKEIVL